MVDLFELGRLVAVVCLELVQLVGVDPLELDLLDAAACQVGLENVT